MLSGLWYIVNSESTCQQVSISIIKNIVYIFLVLSEYVQVGRKAENDYSSGHWTSVLEGLMRSSSDWFADDGDTYRALNH